METESQSLSNSEYESDSSESSVNSSPPPTPTMPRKSSKEKSKSSKSQPKAHCSKTKQIEDGFDTGKKRHSKRSSQGDDPEPESRKSKKIKKHEVSNVTKVDFSEQVPAEKLVPDYQAFLGDKWWLKTTNYGNRQYICLRKYEDNTFAKSPYGNF